MIWLWLALGALAIGLEVLALWRPARGDTLSENLRVRVRRHQWLRWATLAAWALFSVWFAWHIWWQ